VSARGNVRGKGLHDIYTDFAWFRDLLLREEKLKGLCGEYRYKTVCGGCRGRAHAYSGDYPAEDPAASSGKKKRRKNNFHKMYRDGCLVI